MAAVTGLGVGLFVTAYGAYLNLAGSYRASQDRLGLAAWRVDHRRIGPEQLRSARAVPGVATAAVRLVTELPIVLDAGRIAGAIRGRLTVDGRVISLPDATEQPLLDRVLLDAGELPNAPGEVLIEKHFAEYHGLDPGDALRVGLPGEAPLTVSGVGISAEYLWVARSRQDLMPSPSEFGVLFMRRAEIARIAREALDRVAAGADDGRAGASTSGLELAADLEAWNQLLYELDGADRDRETGAADAPDDPRHDAVAAAIGGDGVIERTARAELLGVALLDADVEGMRAVAQFFPVFFLVVGAFIVAALLTRLVESQRSLIGTMTALGVSKGQVLRHYLAFSLVIAALGAIPGAIVGAIGSAVLAHRYAAELGIPFVSVGLHPEIIATALGAAFGVALLAGWMPALRAARLAPAESMRPPAPALGRFLGWSRGRLGGLPLPLRLAVRNLLRRPLRALATSLGVAAALVLIVATNGLFESTLYAVDFQFEEAQRYDVRADLWLPQAATTLEERATAAGATEVETLVTLPAQIRTGETSYVTVLQALPDAPRLQRSLDWSGRDVLPTGDGIVLSRGVALELEVEPGETVTVFVPGLMRSFEAKVEGISEAGLGNSAFLRLETAQRVLGLGDRVNTIVATVAPDGRVALRGAFAELPGLAHIQDLAAMREQFDEWMALTWLLVGIMLAMAVTLAAAVLFNTATLSILERKREIATMRALGTSMRSIATMITIEHALLALPGIAIGLPAAILVLEHALGLYESDLFTLPFVLSPATFILSAVGIVGVLLLAQWPSLRLVGSLDLAESVRARE